MRNGLTVVLAFVMMLSLVPVPAMSQEEIAATPGDAGVIENPLEFDEGPAGFLFTKKDRKEWKKIKSQAAAEEFIDLFWARRNPDPTVSFNPFKAEFDNKVAYADENFGSRGERGALSDRAKVLILLGPPQQADLQTAQEFIQELGADNFGGDQVRGGVWLWLYEPDQLPPELGATGNRLMLMFYEDRMGSNRFELDRSSQANPNAAVAQRVLAKAPEVLLLHPDLKEVPKPVSMPGARPASAAHLAWLDGPPPEWADRAIVLVETGVGDISSRPQWMQIELPGEAPHLDLLVGNVSGPDGEVLSTFELDAEPVAIRDHTAYHLGFPLAAGDYSLAVVGAAGGEPRVAYTSDVTVPAAVDEGTWMSQIWVTTDTEIRDTVLLGSPYCFGRMHIHPLRSGDEVSRQSQLTFMGFVARPGQDESGEPKAKARIALKRDGERLGRPLELPMEVLQVTGDLYVFINAINLAALPETGEYGLSFSIRDQVSDVTVEREIELSIVDDASAEDAGEN